MGLCEDRILGLRLERCPGVEANVAARFSVLVEQTEVLVQAHKGVSRKLSPALWNRLQQSEMERCAVSQPVRFDRPTGIVR